MMMTKSTMWVNWMATSTRSSAHSLRVSRDAAGAGGWDGSPAAPGISRTPFADGCTPRGIPSDGDGLTGQSESKGEQQPRRGSRSLGERPGVSGPSVPTTVYVPGCVKPRPAHAGPFARSLPLRGPVLARDGHRGEELLDDRVRRHPL